MKIYKYLLLQMLFLFSVALSGQSGGFDPSNPPEPNIKPKYNLSLQSNPKNAGSIYGSGEYEAGTQVWITAYNNGGFKFKSWNEGSTIISTSYSFQYTTKAESVTLTAHFEYDPDSPAEPNPEVKPIKYKLYLEANPKQGGSFNRSSGSSFEEGQNISLYPYPNTGYKFREWRKGDVVLSSNPNYSYTMGTEDVTITGVFYYDPTSPSEPNAPNDIEHHLIALTQRGDKGQTIAYPIYLLNHNIDVSSLSFEMEFPEGASVNYQETILSGRKNGHTLNCSKLTGNNYRFVINSSETNDPFLQSNGIILTIPITLSDSWKPEQAYPVILKNALITTPMGELTTTVKNGALIVNDSEEQNIYARFHTTSFLNRVLFSNLSSEDATDFLWNFGDGTTSTEKEPLHVYSKTGNYTVTLAASNSVSSDTVSMSIGINSESYWNVSGIFSLNENKKDVKNFTSLEELFGTISKSAISGDLTIQTEAGKTFSFAISASNYEVLNSIKNKLQQNKRKITFSKDGGGANPVIAITGIPTTESLLLIQEISRYWVFENVSLSVFGVNIDISKIDSFTGQSVCSGSPTNIVDFSVVSNDLTYQWSLQNPTDEVTGYISSGSGNIPAMTLINNSADSIVLNYQISVKYQGAQFYQIDYPVTVHPILSGEIGSLFPSGGMEVAQTSVQLSWSMIKNASYDIYIWEAGSEVPTLPFAKGLQAFQYIFTSGQYGKAYSWKVVASNKCVTLESEVAQFNIRKLPDLHVTGIDNSSLYAGQTANISWTVKNDGPGATVEQSWNDRIYLVSIMEDGTDAEYTQLLKTVPNVSGLASGESYQNSIDVTIPERISGTYYILVTTDMNPVLSIDWAPTGGNFAPNPYTPDVSGSPYPYLFASHSSYYNTVIEVSDNGGKSDNFFYKKVDVLSSPVADLMVATSSYQSSVFSGNKMDISWTVKNQGEKAITSGNWQDAVYISKSEELDNTALYVGTYYYRGGLAVNESYNATLNVTIPNYIGGDYNVFIKTDATDQIFESIYENNNTYKSSVVLQVIMTPPPDLSVTELTAPESADIRGKYTIKFTVANQGAGATIEGNWTDAVYLSPTPTFDKGTANRLASVWRYSNLEIDGKYEVSVDVTIPDKISGDWYFVVETDSEKRVFEYENEDNNVLVCSHSTAILFPNLKVSAVSVPENIQSNEKTEITWTVENIGSADIATIQVTDKLYISPSPVWNEADAVLLASADYPNNLQSGKSIVNKLEVTLPCLNDGTYYIHVITDATDAIYENGFDTDNILASEGRLLTTSDLVIESASLSASTVNSGEDLDLTFTVKNNGTGDLTGKSVLNDIFLSQSATANEAMTKIASDKQTLSLKTGESTTISTKITMPNGTSGTYYVIVEANADSLICETSYANNHKATSAIEVTLTPWPDLQAVDIQAPLNLIASNTAEIQYEVANKGIAALSEGTFWTDKLFISEKATLDTTATLLAEVYQNRALAINGNYTEKVKVTVPASLSGGGYYVLLHTDANDNLYEYLSENNNVRASASVSVTPYPLDIMTESVTATTEAKWQQEIPVTFVVRNISEKNTLNADWADGIYISEDNVWNESDKLLKEIKHSGHLQPNGQYEVNTTISIPNGLIGNHYLLVVADHKLVNFDVNHNNNVKSHQITISSIPTPDLVIEDITIIDPSFSGQPFRVGYTVKNEGTGNINAGTWNDKFYYSSKQSLDEEAFLLKNSLKEGFNLSSGESYRDTVELTIPLPNSGNFVLFLHTDANNAIYEYTGESNNVSNVNILVSLPLPGDLLPENIDSEKQLISGEKLNVAWNITNKGTNPVNSSNLKDLIYLSEDNVFDVSDKLIGQVSGSVSIPAYGSVERSVSARISGFKEGDYFILVKTDANNSVNENDKANNLACSAYPVQIRLKELQVNTKQQAVLENNSDIEYKMSVNDVTGETILIQVLSADSLKGAVNNLHIKNNDIANNISNDVSSDGQFSPNPQILIPSAKPDYYGIAVTGNTPQATKQQNISIQADVLPFEIRSVNPSYGGNTGITTVELTGAKLDQGMKVWLENGNNMIVANNVIKVNSSKAYAQFDLTGKDAKQYDVCADNEGDGKITAKDKFEVRLAEKNLHLNIILPTNMRPNRIVSAQLEYANLGNTDLKDVVVYINSTSGAPIALSPGALNSESLQIEIPLATVNGNILPPGAKGTVTFYIYTSHSIAFTYYTSEDEGDSGIITQPQYVGITATAGDNGQITPVGNTVIEYGGNKEFEIIATEGYGVYAVWVNDSVNVTSELVDNKYTFMNVTEDQSIHAEFIKTHVITATTTEGGTISPEGAVKVLDGSDVVFTITANDGYSISEVLLNGTDVVTSDVTDGQYTLTDITGDCSITAKFVKATYTIKAEAGLGGKIDPEGEIQIEGGTNKTFIITPDFGFSLYKVIANGKDVTSQVNYYESEGVHRYTVLNVNEDYEITAFFSISNVVFNYTIKANAHDGGTINPSGTIKKERGDDAAFNISANTGNIISRLLVDGEEVSAAKGLTSYIYTFQNIQKSHTIEVWFVPAYHQIVASANSGGWITPKGIVSVNHGADQTFTIRRDWGHHIYSVIVDGVNVTSQLRKNADGTHSYTFRNVIRNHEIKVNFYFIGFTHQHEVKAIAYNGGRITPAGITKVETGTDFNLSIYANEGYEIWEVRINNDIQTAAKGQSSYPVHLKNIQRCYTVTATFRKKSYVITASAGEGGWVSPPRNVKYHGDCGIVFVYARQGYEIVSITENGRNISDVEGKPSYAHTVCPTRDTHVHATFRLKEQDLSVTIKGHPVNSDPCDDPAIALSATARGGTSPYSYYWSTGARGSRIEVTESGYYSVTVADKQGRTASYGVYVFIGTGGIQCAVDPNEISGPVGYGEYQMIAQKDKTNYTVMFENDPEFATAPASRVKVTYPASEKQNVNSIRLGEFGFGSFIFNIPENSTSYYKRLDVSDQLGVWVDVTAGVDVTKKELFWIFQSIDPQTGVEPVNAQLGFLPVNNKETGNGEGYVRFSILPATTTQTGDIVKAQASIVFDDNAAIATNIWSNVIDAAPPVSSVDTRMIDDATVEFKFTGQDDTGGSGIAYHSLYVSKNNGAYTEHGSFGTDSICLYTTETGTTYSFYSVAVDNVGNVEAAKATPEFVKDNNKAPTDLLLSETNFLMMSSIGTYVGLFSTVDDDDNNSMFIYSLVTGESSTHNELFEIHNGGLYLASDFSKVENKDFSIRVRTTDAGGLFFEKAFVITISDFDRYQLRGDANADGVVNEDDVDITVDYISGGYPSDFVFKLADVDEDDAIRINDVVGIIDIFRNPLNQDAISTEPVGNADVRLRDNIITVHSDKAVGGLDITLENNIVESIQMLHALDGFEKTFYYKSNKLHVMLYSVAGNALVSGQDIQLIELSELTKIESVELCDPQGNPILASIENPTGLNSGREVSGHGIYPNPVKDEAYIRYNAGENINKVILYIYDNAGRRLSQMESTPAHAGENEIHWLRGGLASGFHYYVLFGFENNKLVFRNSQKFILE